MKPSLTDILPLLNASCGDVLKVALLQEFFPTLPKINPMWLKVPTGDVETAFAALKMARVPESPAAMALNDFKLDAIKDVRDSRFVDPDLKKIVRENTTAKTIAAMPSSLRFDDVEALAGPQVDLADGTVVAGEITLEAAAAKFSYSYVGLANRLRAAGITGVKRPGEGRTLFFRLAEVEGVCASKGKHRK